MRQGQGGWGYFPVRGQQSEIDESEFFIAEKTQSQGRGINGIGETIGVHESLNRIGLLKEFGAGRVRYISQATARVADQFDGFAGTPFSEIKLGEATGNLDHLHEGCGIDESFQDSSGSGEIPDLAVELKNLGSDCDTGVTVELFFDDVVGEVSKLDESGPETVVVVFDGVEDGDFPEKSQALEGFGGGVEIDGDAADGTLGIIFGQEGSHSHLPGVATEHWVGGLGFESSESLAGTGGLSGSGLEVGLGNKQVLGYELVIGVLGFELINAGKGLIEAPTGLENFVKLAINSDAPLCFEGEFFEGGFAFGQGVIEAFGLGIDESQHHAGFDGSGVIGILLNQAPQFDLGSKGIVLLEGLLSFKEAFFGSGLGATGKK